MVEPVPPPPLAARRDTPRSIVDMALRRDPERPPADSGRRQAPSIRLRMIRTVTNSPLRIPRGDWERIVVGSKRMYRTYGNDGANRFVRLFKEGEEFPRPALIYSQVDDKGSSYRPGAPVDVRPAVVLSYRQEPLGAISAEDLALELFADVRSFRRYWRARYPKWGWRSNDMINVVELRPWGATDDQEQGEWLLERLFGEHREQL